MSRLNEVMQDSHDTMMRQANRTLLEIRIGRLTTEKMRLQLRKDSLPSMSEERLECLKELRAKRKELAEAEEALNQLS